MPTDDLLDLLLGCGCKKKCCCGEEEAPASQRPSNLFQSQPRTVRPPPLPEESSFIPVVPSFDTTQRVTRFGLSHVPSTQGHVFMGEGGTSSIAPSFVQDDGTSAALVADPRIDHSTREIEGYSLTATQTTSGLSQGAIMAVPLEQAVARPEEERLTPYEFQPFIFLEQIIRETGRGLQSQGVARLTQRWDTPEIEVDVLASTSAPGTVYTTEIWHRLNFAHARITDFAERVTWREISFGSGVFYDRIKTFVGDRESNPASRLWVSLWELGLERHTAEDWAMMGVIPNLEEVTYTIVTGPLEYQAWEEPLGALPNRTPGVRWISPDGEVQVTGPDTTDHADLTDATLSAYGQTFEEGSWTALRGLPTQNPDGTWTFEQVIVLHESGGTVTAIRETGAVETCSLSTFTTEVLRTDTFDRFSSVGQAFSSWPPQWALAECGLDTRAIAAHDPWRDSIKSKAAPGYPAHWFWPGRPAKRPKTLPASAPHSPLGVTLADVVGAAGEDEPLARAEAPWRLPVQVEVLKDEEWVVSPIALTTLAQRRLYAPASWPDDPLDRVSLRGPVRLTFGDG